MLSVLEKRGYINAIAGYVPLTHIPSTDALTQSQRRERNELDQLMTNKRIGAYVGVDPTAPSLHVGHLLPLMALFWLHVHGFHTVSLVCNVRHLYVYFILTKDSLAERPLKSVIRLAE